MEWKEKTMNAKIPGVVKNLEGPAEYDVVVKSNKDPYHKRARTNQVKAFFVESGMMTVAVYPPEHNPKQFIFKEPETFQLRSQCSFKIDPATDYEIVVGPDSKIYQMEWAV